MLNIVGHRLDDDPAPVIYTAPTKSMVDKIISPRVRAMIEQSATLRLTLVRGKGTTRTYIRVAGTTVRLAWAGSASELKAESAALIIVDERDGMRDDVSHEGDIVDLLTARHWWYVGGLLIVISSPTLGQVESEVDPLTGHEHWQLADPDDVSPTWQRWQEGTRYEWAWPCPGCMEYFVPRMKLLTYPSDATPKEAARKAGVACPGCGLIIHEPQKEWMNAHGVYIAPGQRALPYRAGDEGVYFVVANGEDVRGVTHKDRRAAFVPFGDVPILPGEDPGDIASFWESGLTSRSVSFGERARALVRALASGNAKRIQAVVNTGFGELYSVAAEQLTEEDLAHLLQPYLLGQVPEDVQLLTSGADVQADGIYWVVRGWGAHERSWLIDYGFMSGDTRQQAVFDALLEQLTAKFGPGLHVFRGGIDCRYRKDQVYHFCAGRDWLMAMMGRDTLSRPLTHEYIETTWWGRGAKSGMSRWKVNVDHFKSMLHERWGREPHDERAWLLPQNVDNDYLRQITAEQRVPGSRGRWTWMRIRRANHYLDCEVYAAAAAFQAQVHRLEPVEKGEAPAESVILQPKVQAPDDPYL